MKPKIPDYRQERMFEKRLDSLISLEHPLVRLRAKIDWKKFEDKFGLTYVPDNGRPGVSTRLMLGLVLLKFLHSVSDREVLHVWVENPYWQYFCGEEYFQHKPPAHHSNLLHEPATEAIAKGKAHKRFEYGVKVSVVSTRKSGFVLGCKAMHGNPYDGHTLAEALNDAKERVGKVLKAKVGVDLGYRGHGIKEGFQVMHPRLKRLSRPDRLFVRARSKIEATISLLKRCYRMGRNYLKGVLGDKLNAMYSAAAHNFAITLRSTG